MVGRQPAQISHFLASFKGGRLLRVVAISRSEPAIERVGEGEVEVL